MIAAITLLFGLSWLDAAHLGPSTVAPPRPAPIEPDDHQAGPPRADVTPPKVIVVPHEMAPVEPVGPPPIKPADLSPVTEPEDKTSVVIASPLFSAFQALPVPPGAAWIPDKDGVFWFQASNKYVYGAYNKNRKPADAIPVNRVK